MSDRIQTGALQIFGQSPTDAIRPVDAARTRAYIDAATAVNTRRAYRSDWTDFTVWCEQNGLMPLPATPESVALYLGALAQVAKVSTVGRRLTAIAKAHRAAGYETPTKSEVVHLIMRGIRRTHGVAPTQKAPAVLAVLPINRHGHIGEARLGDKAVALVVKRSALAAGLDPTKYAGHSLRAGLATSAAAGGAQERDIMRQTGHRSVQMLRRYIRDGELFRDNAAAQAGL
jgi:site-specific recombinase XerD